MAQAEKIVALIGQVTEVPDEATTVCTHCFFFYLMVITVQWGHSAQGSVNLPIAFSKIGKIFTQHNGSAFYESRASADNVLSSFMLYVTNKSTETESDANWFAIGY